MKCIWFCMSFPVILLLPAYTLVKNTWHKSKNASKWQRFYKSGHIRSACFTKEYVDNWLYWLFQGSSSLVQQINTLCKVLFFANSKCTNCSILPLILLLLFSLSLIPFHFPLPPILVRLLFFFLFVDRETSVSVVLSVSEGAGLAVGGSVSLLCLLRDAS